MHNDGGADRTYHGLALQPPSSAAGHSTQYAAVRPKIGSGCSSAGLRAGGMIPVVCGRIPTSHNGCLVSGRTGCVREIFPRKRRSQTGLRRARLQKRNDVHPGVRSEAGSPSGREPEASAAPPAVESMLQGTQAAPQSEGGLYGATWLCSLGSCNWVCRNGWGAGRRRNAGEV